MASSKFELPPLNWDPVDDILSIFEGRLTVDDRIVVTRAKLAASKAMLTAQLDLINQVEQVVNKQMG